MATEKIGAIKAMSINFSKLPCEVSFFDPRIQSFIKKNKLKMAPRINTTFVHDRTVTKKSGVIPKKKKRIFSNSFGFNSDMCSL
jgi:hypothetical protein